MRRIAASLLALPLSVSLFFACGAPSKDGGSDSDGAGANNSGIDGLDPEDGFDPDDEAPPGCGDGALTEDEACDDGNREDGDGCYGNCLGVDPGFTCPTPGELCKPFARCGDGVVSFPEQCDDGATVSGDGCTATCKVEVGYKCDNGVCVPTTCGDGIVEGAETCDDGNALPFDGCSEKCIGEPDCSGGACTSACGDGIVLGEACDDGNTLAGDGCSPTCTVELGYDCSGQAECAKDADGKCILPIPAIFRDFSYAHSDFNESSCTGTGATTGLVQNMLTDGKPVRAGSGATMCMTNFGDWYVSKSGTNVTFPSTLTLYDDGAGNFVNRYGANGERWVTKAGWNCSQPTSNCEYDGSPFFFPVDGIPGALDDGGETAAVSTSEYGMDGTTYTQGVADGTGANPNHNFAFTSEVTYWFQYDAAVSATLTFFGDDDVWVFVNGKLAVDLGGLHQAISGSVTIGSGTAATYGLEAGKVYQIKVFHAERKPKGSTFRLTLSGFSTSRSDCKSDCGDGIIGFGEECDDGVNDGGYNECGADCKLGSYCGDGVVDPGEDCDDGRDNATSGCGNACRKVVVR